MATSANGHEDTSLVRRGDPDAMIKAIAWLTATGLPFSRPSAAQLKIGSLSFYPTSGTMNFDAQAKELVRGLQGLKITLERILNRKLPKIDENAGGVVVQFPVDRL